MSGNLYYLLTVLPVLPNAPGEPSPAEDALARLRDEDDAGLLYLAELLDVESEIARCGQQFFVEGRRDFQPVLSERLPEDFVGVFLSFSVQAEADWHTSIYAAWFELLMKTSVSLGSGLLGQWSRWEYSLRTLLRLDRLKAHGKAPADLESLIPSFMKESVDEEIGALVEAYKTFSEPLKAEKFLDQARIDYLRRAATHYSFSLDELIAYLLELRIHNRYARLNPDKGRKILEEVTTL